MTANAIAVHLNQEFLGKDFFEIPEMKHIHRMFLRAQRGIRFHDVEDKITYRIRALFTLDDFERTLEVVKILHELAKHPHYNLLSGEGFINSFHGTENMRMDKIYEFVFNNFHKPISSSQAAEIINMNPAAFYKFFKRVHRKAFTRYTNEIGNGYAHKLQWKKKVKALPKYALNVVSTIFLILTGNLEASPTLLPWNLACNI